MTTFQRFPAEPFPSARVLRSLCGSKQNPFLLRGSFTPFVVPSRTLSFCEGPSLPLWFPAEPFPSARVLRSLCGSQQNPFLLRGSFPLFAVSSTIAYG